MLLTTLNKARLAPQLTALYELPLMRTAILFCVLCLSHGAFARDATDELIDILGYEKALLSLKQESFEEIQSSLELMMGDSPTQEVIELSNHFLSELELIYESYLGWEFTHSELRDALEGSFSKQELEELARTYRDPLVRKFSKWQFKLSAEYERSFTQSVGFYTRDAIALLESYKEKFLLVHEIE
ncbi:MAG: hypothetical protein ABJ308_14985 [Halieaceae bacterium]